MTQKRIMRRRVRIRDIYARDAHKIKNFILLDGVPKEKEINITSAYRRSTFTLGDYVTLDYDHRLKIKGLMKSIEEYSNDFTRKRPLNIIMLAEPGSGKSHFIKCLAHKIDKVDISAVTFNMSSLKDADDLIQPLEAVRNIKVVDSLPLLFLDEFDSNDKNFSLLLPLLWDGELHLAQRDVKVGKVVIILAGSDPQIKETMRNAKSMIDDNNSTNIQYNDNKKIRDLLSRINGGDIEIPGLETITSQVDRRVDKICISISLLQQRYGSYLKMVPWAFLRFVGLNRFRYGVRSIAHLIDLIACKEKVENILTLENLDLPLGSIKELKESSLAYHILAEGKAENIIEMWNDIKLCGTLVRFQEEEKEEED